MKRDVNRIEHYKATKGNVCMNCGSIDNIEYHHIVPLCNGGFDIDTNVIALCYDCHLKAHDRIHHLEHIRERLTGRQRNVDKATSDLWIGEWLDGNIATNELYDKLNIKNRKGRSYSAWDIRAVKEYIEEHNIDKAANEREHRAKRRRLNKDYRIGKGERL